MAKVGTDAHDYQTDLPLIQTFLSTFRARLPPSFQLSHVYRDGLQRISNREEQGITVDTGHVAEFNGDLAERIEANTMRYVDLFSQVIDTMLPAPTVPIKHDVIDTLTEQRKRMAAEAEPDAIADPSHGLPPLLLRRYSVHFVPRATAKPVPLRNVRAGDVGRLVVISGMVTRMTDVRPLMNVATYTCDTCGNEIYQEVLSRQFMPLDTCPSRECTTNKAKSELTLETRGCKFVKYQEIRLQELADQVPVGHTPRQMTIHARGDLVRKCSPGEVVTISGVFLPVPFTGFRQMTAGLIADVYIEAMAITKKKETYKETAASVDPELLKISSENPEIYSKLARSIAPEIFGHEDVKKALLLQMIGGVTRSMNDGLKIRGDINICMVGDPGVAKSQLLKHVATIAPRGIYTSGKGSSGVGLTAAVMKDTLTGEFVLEGGALVLADNGICCIDEFDKMEDSDRTAIHEVMEQQTVSIAKAGITTTLNARTAVLAAANPVYSRYDVSKSISYNVNLPEALLSRFDLLFLMIDRPDDEKDHNLALHVLNVHMKEGGRRNLPTSAGNNSRSSQSAPVSENSEYFKPAELRAYIAHAREFEPYVASSAVANQIVLAYVDMRENNNTTPGQRRNNAGSGANVYDDTYITARSLLGILRLSQALARIRLSNEIELDDVQEAIRLIRESKSSTLYLGATAPGSRAHVHQPLVNKIWIEINDLFKRKDKKRLLFSEVEEHVIKKGGGKYSAQEFEKAIDHYSAESLGMCFISGKGKTRMLCLV